MSCGIGAKGLKIMGRKGRPIIRDIDLEIAPGSFVGIIGESGAGKSTLLRALSIHLGKQGDYGDLFLKHEGGRSLVNGETHDAYLERLGFVPQEDHFIGELTAEETLRSACTFADVPASEIAGKCRALFGSVGLPEEILANPIHTLSGGQKRRLSIARALASDPEILFLDEPTSGLDLPIARGIMEMLEELCRTGGITIVCTSHLPSTLKVCDRVLSMSAGKSGKGGYISGDYDADAYCSALHAEENGAAVYGEGTPQRSGADRSNENEGSKAVEMPDPAGEKRKGNHFSAIFERSRNAWWRDRSNVVTFAVQPVVLAFIVVLTQSLHGEYAGEFIDFFLTVSALWIGMSLCIRDFVSERKLYALDELSGLSKVAYLWAKFSFAAALSVAGVLILCLVAHLAVQAADSWFDLAHAGSRFTVWHFMPRFLILGIVGISGALIGLFLSLVAPTERTAISLMPLALLPQVVFSRFACGFGSGPDRERTFPFHALTFREETGTESANLLDRINYIASLPMTTRHSSWSLDSLTLNGFEWEKFYRWDFAVLIALVVVQVTVVGLAFYQTANHSLSRIR